MWTFFLCAVLAFTWISLDLLTSTPRPTDWFMLCFGLAGGVLAHWLGTMP